MKDGSKEIAGAIKINIESIGKGSVRLRVNIVDKKGKKVVDFEPNILNIGDSITLQDISLLLLKAE